MSGPRRSTRDSAVAQICPFAGRAGSGEGQAAGAREGGGSVSFSLLEAHRGIEPILGRPLNRAGVEALVTRFEKLDDDGRLLLVTALALAANQQTSALCELLACHRGTGE